MNGVRTRATKTAYKRYLRSQAVSSVCQFCDIEQNDNRFVAQTAHFMVITNIFPYTQWDNQPVEKHLLIVPKAHILQLKGLSPLASKEYVDLISDYEHSGYNVYARAPSSTARSVVHQHTHLIKLGKAQPKRRFRLKPLLTKYRTKGMPPA